MAVEITSLKNAILEVRHSSAKGEDMVSSFKIPAKLAREIFAGGAKKTMRKSEKGGEYDTLVVRLYTDAVVANAGSGGNGKG